MDDVDDLPDPKLPIPEAWWQCRYCDENFNARNKLTIHMNNHEEHDNNDHTCTDCGNIYRTRKSLSVHRHKKHPRLPNPSTCELCEKVFFDKTELFYHLKTHSNADVFTHLSEMQTQLKEEQQSLSGVVQGEQLNCHLCGQKFHDKRVLSKHLRLHEATDTSFTDPLTSMLADQTSTGLDENGSDFIYPQYQGQMVDGEYACDMCPKTFPLMNALKVHRGWHFRSPDGRQVTDPSNMWQPDTVPQSKIRRSRTTNPPVCPYCNSTFASGNNLRRHIVEVHKRNEAKMMRENGTVSDSVYVEKELECHTCNITFSNRAEWVDHKISHARTMKPSTTFEWGCEICGKVFTRKERLLAHMIVHLSGKDELSVHSGDQNSEIGGEGNSRSSMSSQSQSHQSLEGMRNRQERAAARAKDNNHSQDESMKQDDDDADRDEEEEDEVEDEEMQEEEQDETEQPNDDDDEYPNTEAQQSEAAYSCDLCQVFFRTAKELRRHVTSHIINGPELTITSSNQRESATQPEQQPDEEERDDEEEYEEELDNEDGNIDEEEEDEEEYEERNQQVGNNKSPILDGFKCRLCGSSSESHIGMIQCMDSHKVQSSHRCGECKLFFSSEQQIDDHQMLCHPKDYNDEDDEDIEDNEDGDNN